MDADTTYTVGLRRDGAYRMEMILSSRFDRIEVPREPRDDRERQWLDFLRNRLTPSGEFVILD